MIHKLGHLPYAILTCSLLLQASCATSNTPPPSVSFAETCNEETDKNHLEKAAWLLGTGLTMVGTHYALHQGLGKQEHRNYSVFLLLIPGAAISQFGIYSLFAPSSEEREAERCRKIREMMRQDLEALQKEKAIRR